MIKRITTLLALAVVTGCANIEMHAAHDCFEDNGILVFDGFGDVGCMDRTEYALAKELQPGELVSAADANPPDLNLDQSVLLEAD